MDLACSKPLPSLVLGEILPLARPTTGPLTMRFSVLAALLRAPVIMLAIRIASATTFPYAKTRTLGVRFFGLAISRPSTSMWADALLPTSSGMR